MARRLRHLHRNLKVKSQVACELEYDEYIGENCWWTCLRLATTCTLQLCVPPDISSAAFNLWISSSSMSTSRAQRFSIDAFALSSLAAFFLSSAMSIYYFTPIFIRTHFVHSFYYSHLMCMCFACRIAYIKMSLLQIQRYLRLSVFPSVFYHRMNAINLMDGSCWKLVILTTTKTQINTSLQPQNGIFYSRFPRARAKKWC